MNVLPVITRELRAEARHAFTYWLRVLGAGAVILAAAIFILSHGFSARLGAQLFQQLHFTVQLAIWLIVPLLTADCLSRERREGTLGLLFLTPLKALDIVIAKSLAHGLRAVTLLLAVLPVVALPLLMGGVTWQQAVSSLLLNGAAICLALAAGLLASALSKSWVRSLILAYALAILFANLFFVALGGIFSTLQPMFLPSFGGSPSWLKPGFQLAISIDPNFFANYYSYSYIRFSYTGMPGGASGTMLQVILATSAISLLLSIVTLLLVAVVTAIITKRNWQERPPHPFAVWFKHRLCTPVVMLDLLQRWMKRKLERNPIGWLEQRTWSGRLVIWGWFAVMISVYSLVLTDANFLTRNLTATHVLMGWMLLISMAVNASTSFRRERENRVLELLLVSPLNESQIILGRLRGLWDQFLPSMVLLLGGWVYLSTSLQHHEDGSTIIFFATSFLTVPIIGLYFSLTCRNFLTALIATIIVAMILPVIWNSTFTFILRLLSIGLIQIDADALALIFHPGLIQLALAAWLGWWMHRRLVHRRFATEST